MSKSTTTPATARRAAATAAARLIRCVGRAPRELIIDGMPNEPPPTNERLSGGCIFSALAPSASVCPECIVCGSLLTWLDVAEGRRRLPLGRGGFYGLCISCVSKDEES